MPGIICAIRGGPASQPTIKKAIQIALETQFPIYFLYIINLDFLTHTSISRTRLLVEELHEMGKFILSTAQDQAESRGVKAEGVIRKGQIGVEINKLCQEINADYVIFGQPLDEHKENNLTHERLNEIKYRIEQECVSKVVFAEGEE